MAAPQRHLDEQVEELITVLRARLARLLRAAADHVAPAATDPVSRLLDEAPPDDEELAADEAEAAEGAWAEYQRGESHSLDEIKRELA